MLTNWLLANASRFSIYCWIPPGKTVTVSAQHTLQNFVTSLEKRVRSRLPMARIVFRPASSFDDYVSSFGIFLGLEGENMSSEWLKFVNGFIASSPDRAELNYLFSADNSYSILKKVASIFLCFYIADTDNKSASDLLTDARCPCGHCAYFYACIDDFDRAQSPHLWGTEKSCKVRSDASTRLLL
ncbi:unnamed protein product [Nippostrongylus brasiliensis]|uniref:HECT domain-containing protein n=1 Tax=Nippostrongylus brasiliensis TaxID=27835 RepID=A0A0N4XQV4_NIPBR|nr:unnamed protein product [Nippostrongylus brasiliensis]